MTSTHTGVIARTRLTVISRRGVGSPASTDRTTTSGSSHVCTKLTRTTACQRARWSHETTALTIVYHTHTHTHTHTSTCLSSVGVWVKHGVEMLMVIASLSAAANQSHVGCGPHPLSCDRQHLSYDVCLEVRGEIITTVLFCIVYWSCAQ